jgi:TatD DNase family protein
MFLVDTHCHLDSATLSGPLSPVLRHAHDSGVERLLTVGFDIHSSVECIEIASMHSDTEPDIYAAAGIHPHEAKSAEEGFAGQLKTLLKHPRVSALGEIGLDYFYDNSPREVQRKIFAEQIEIAKEAKKPIVIHVRDAKVRSEGDANSEVYAMLKDAHAEITGGVIHCFSGNMQDAENALGLGFYISFAGPVTYPRCEELRKIARTIPIDRILCETDSPYLTPQPKRGSKNEPSFVRYVYETIAGVRGMELEELAEEVLKNSARLFGWN